MALECVTVKHSAALAGQQGAALRREGLLDSLHGERLFTPVVWAPHHYTQVTVPFVLERIVMACVIERRVGPPGTILCQLRMRVPIPLVRASLCVVLRANELDGCSVSKSPGHFKVGVGCRCFLGVS